MLKHKPSEQTCRDAIYGVHILDHERIQKQHTAPGRDSASADHVPTTKGFITRKYDATPH